DSDREDPERDKKDEIYLKFKEQEDDLVNSLELNDKQRKDAPKLELPKEVLRVRPRKDSKKEVDKFSASPDGKKLSLFRSAYLNWCDKLKIVPASELLRNMKLSLK